MLNQQFLISENMNMKVIDVLIEIPCFKCLFNEPIRDSHLHCNPNTCEKLEDWLLKQIEQDAKAEEIISLANAHTKTQH